MQSSDRYNRSTGSAPDKFHVRAGVYGQALHLKGRVYMCSHAREQVVEYLA
jgi:hypothetical protein